MWTRREPDSLPPTATSHRAVGDGRWRSLGCASRDWLGGGCVPGVRRRRVRQRRRRMRVAPVALFAYDDLGEVDRLARVQAQLTRARTLVWRTCGAGTDAA